MKRMNRTGGEKLLSIWWFMVLAMVGVAIVIGVAVFYSAEVDTRTLEAAVLYERIADCVNENGFADYGFFSGTKDIYRECDLKRSMFEGESELFFEVVLIDSKDQMVGKSLSGGAASFKRDCEIEQGGVTAKQFPKCVNGVEPIEYRIDGQTYSGKLGIYAGSNQHGIKVGELKIGEQA